MGYYTRVLSTKLECIPFEKIVESLSNKGFGVSGYEESQIGSWDTFEVVDLQAGEVVLLVEYNPVAEGELGYEEIEEFREEVKELKPANGAYWLGLCFDLIKSIYSFQHLSNDKARENGFLAADLIKDLISAHSKSIFQADFEGFTNFEGDYVVWGFSDQVKGKASMALLKEFNPTDVMASSWESFELETSDQQSKKRFLEGKHPNLNSIFGFRFPRSN
jgi:hypothetical protein